MEKKHGVKVSQNLLSYSYSSASESFFLLRYTCVLCSFLCRPMYVFVYACVFICVYMFLFVPVLMYSCQQQDLKWAIRPIGSLAHVLGTVFVNVFSNPKVFMF